MRTRLLPNVLRASLSLASVAATALPGWAAEPRSTVGFVEQRPAVTQWSDPSSNPLRGGSAGTVDGNSLRFTSPATLSAGQPMDAEPMSGMQSLPRMPRTDTNVAPAAYNQSSRSLQLRPHTEPTGIFSNILSGNKAKPATSAAASQPREVLARNPMQATPKPNTAAAAKPKPKSMWPNFLTGATNMPSLNKTGLFAKPTKKTTNPSTSAANTSRAGTVQHALPTDRAVQAAYQSAASAQSYRPTPTGRTNGATRGQALPSQSRTAIAERRAVSAPAPAASAPGTRSLVTNLHAATPALPTINAPTNANTGASSTTLALARAHEMAATAKTEAEYSEILMICQKIRASEASAEETAFGRQLASWSLNRRGQLRAGAGRTEEAMADFDTAVKLDAKCWRAIHNRGVLQAQAGQLEPAFDDFQKTIDLNPNYAKAYSNRAALFVLAGELEQALEDYQRAAKLDPKLAIAHRGCGRTCHMLGRTNEALEHFDAAVKATPNDATTLTARGDLLTDLGYYVDASNDYNRAIEVNTKSADAYRSSAWLLATCPDETVRNPETALQRAEQAARLDTKGGAVTYDTLAAAQAAVGDFGSAVSTMRQAIQLAPPSERGAYQDRLHMYQQSTPYTIAPVASVQQAQYQR